MSQNKWLGLPHEPPEEQCTNCKDWFWASDVVNGLCQPCFDEQEVYEKRMGILQQISLQTCNNCHYRLGSKCRKTKDYTGLSDYCSAWKIKKEEVK